MEPEPLKTFIIYARADEEFKTQLVRHLRPLENNQLLSIWHDGNILPGEDWEKTTEKELAGSDIVLALVSAHFFNSASVQEEMHSALQHLDAGRTRVVPVIVSPCSWDVDPALRRLQALPLAGAEGVRPVAEWNNTDSAWANVVERVNHLARELTRKNGNAAPAPTLRTAAPTPAHPSNKRTAYALAAAVVAVLALAIWLLARSNQPIGPTGNSAPATKPVAEQATQNAGKTAAQDPAGKDRPENKTRSAPSPGPETPAHAATHVRTTLTVSANPAEYGDLLRSKVAGMLRTKGLEFDLNGSGRAAGNRIICQFALKTQPKASGSRDDARSNTLSFRITIQDRAGQVCYTNFLQSKPRISYPEDSRDALDKIALAAWKDIENALRTETITLCKNQD